MLTNDDLNKIKGLLQPIIKRLTGVEGKIDKMAAGIKDLRLETKGIHVILERQEKDFGSRLGRLEDQAGIN